VSRLGKNAQKRAELAQGGYSSRLGLAISTSLAILVRLLLEKYGSLLPHCSLTAPGLRHDSRTCLDFSVRRSFARLSNRIETSAAQEDYNRIVSYAE
jgi:hypothetical protein